MVTFVARARQMFVLICLFASGFLTLVYEVCWVRQASLAFGSATLALSTVLAVFFGGLALGSYLMGGVVRHVRRPLVWYAALEVAIGACALASGWGFAWADYWFEAAYPYVRGSWIGLSALRFALLSAILLPPATLMGGTLPLLCKQIISSDQWLTRSVGLLYGLNTLGAAAGCACGGFWLLPTFGIQATVATAAAANILLGILIAMVSVSQKCEISAQPLVNRFDNTRSPQVVRVLGWWFFVTGFVALGNEVLWARFLTLLVFDTVHTYTLTITVVLVGIVVGSLLSGCLLGRSGREAWWLGMIQISNGLTVLAVLQLPASVWRTIGGSQGSGGPLLVTALVLFVPATLSGMAFPLFIRVACVGYREVAARVGQMTAFNTLGGICGSLAIGFGTLPGWGLQTSLLLTTGLSVMTGLAVWFHFPSPRFSRTVVSLAAVGLWLMLPHLSGTRLPQDYLCENGTLLDYSEGLNGHLAVVRSGDTVRLEADRLWQGEDRKTHQIMAAHIPMLFHEDPQRVAVIGVGPGETASRFLLYPISDLHCIDIDSELFPFIRRFFNGQWLDDPRVQVITEDGRNFITHTDQKYDIVSIEVGQTFRPCVSGFYSVDFYERAKRRLEKDGLLVQFASLEFLGEEEFRTVVRSFLQVFPQSVLWYNRAELLLIGTTAERIKLSHRQLDAMLQNDMLKRDLQFSYWGGAGCRLDRVEPLLAGFLAGPAELMAIAAAAPLYYSDRPFLEYATSRSRPDSLRPVVQLLRQHLYDVATLPGVALEAESWAEISALQEQNLDDLLASELNWQALDWIARRELPLTIACARQAREHNPRNFWSNLLLADALAAEGRQREAVLHYEMAVAIRPEDAGARSRLSLAREKAAKGA